jgi:hypothetical protein
MSVLVSTLVNVRAPPDAQDGFTSFPALVVNLWSTPLTWPVRGDKPISHRFRASPLVMERITALPAADQHPGLGPSVASRARSFAWIRDSYAPVLIAFPAFMGTSHQSMLELS